jgi:hypothetical protein
VVSTGFGFDRLNQRKTKPVNWKLPNSPVLFFATDIMFWQHPDG